MKSEQANHYLEMDQSVNDDTIKMILGYTAFVIFMALLGCYLLYWMDDILV